ncbi:hypothetical protein [Roseovarius sp. MMSF_3298]|uniref:hypothetical protein n=1 Tax=unclassified Roseovarius TaxID=2614913 RepID=UPI003531E47D
MRTRLLNVKLSTKALFFVAFCPGAGAAATCSAPVRPYLPDDSQAVRDYADIIRRDFETYITDIQNYLRCLEAERARAFQEAREVSQEYGRFTELIEQ